MKKQLLLLVLLVTGFASTITAQEQRQRMTLEERLKMVKEKLAPLQLNATQQASTDSVMKVYFDAQQKQREEMRASGEMPDRETMRAKMKVLADDRDAALRKVFTADQYKKWKEEIEPSLRPQRPQGGQ